MGRESDALDAFTFAPRASAATPPAGLRVPAALWSEVLAHLAGDAPAEAVGLLAVAEAPAGEPATGARFFPGTNLDASPTRYTMDPVEVIAALREMDDRGWRLGAIVHSHPATAAIPSATDLGEAYYPDALMVIVSLATAPPVARAWRIAAADGRGRPGAVLGEAPLAIVEERAGGSGDRRREPSDGDGNGGSMGGWELAGEAEPVAVTPTAPRRATEAIVAALEAFPVDLGRALDGHPKESLLRPARDGGWGVVEILPHLRDWEEIFLERVRQVLNEERPFLPTFDDELWAIERDYRGQDPHAVADRLRALREEMLGLLRGLPPDAWNRLAEHGAYGPVTLAWMTDRIADHDQEHLEQIRDALA